MKRYINGGKKHGVVELTRGDDGLYRDAEGTIFALREDGGADHVDRLGIWPFVIPRWMTPKDVLEIAARHDFKYDCPAYQAFHSRAEADRDLRREMRRSSWSILAEPFYIACDIVGRLVWENKKTR